MRVRGTRKEIGWLINGVFVRAWVINAYNEILISRILAEKGYFFLCPRISMGIIQNRTALSVNYQEK